MELLDVTLILGVLGVIITAALVTVFRVFPQKSPQRAMKASITELQRVQNQQFKDIKERNDSEFRSLRKRNTDLEKELYGGAQDEEPKVSWEIIKAGAQQNGINPILLEPFKKAIMKHTKGMSIDEIQGISESLKGFMGGKGLGIGNTPNNQLGTDQPIKYQ